ncbi:MAG: serine/threonine-protein kinase PknK, partial [Proteobacteria bacterium]|nr:serine/threonine-protein kinase PknK [Pseudomonadota bacterium]
MIEIEGYRITEQIYKSSHSVIYRGEHVGEKRAVVLKKLKNDYPTVEELAGFRREYETTRSFDLEGIVRVIGLEKYRNTLVMVLEDFAGQSLADLIPKMSYDLAEFLQLSVHLAEILGQIHRQQVMHKDINPSNIIWNPRTDQIKIIDFGISTALSRENPEVRNPDAIEGTLAYISPEQTGRMNRAMDYRTDFYSLGVAFYEMLTRRLPFETQDAMELVHAHLAKTPPPPSALKRDIPKVVSDIVSKLMAKKAEERYQSAFGLKSDLQLCLDRLRGDGTLEAFEIGRRDTSERFQIPQKLYGREKEIETLLQAFQRVRQGGKETMLAIGDSGIGKSALVYEVFKPITEKQGYFISGKFDPFQRNVPYASLIQAFQGLVRQLLTENERNLATWKTKLLKAVGPNGQIVVDVIPDMELILGKQPAIPELPATESQNRFNLVFQNFMRVFASEGRPLILFLDDLQWADAASLKLIELLMADLKRRHILMVGAYREADIDTLHPWPVVLENLRKAGADVDTIALQPLVKIQVNRLVSETLACDPSVSESLSNLCFEKTRGHPFFLIQFLTALYEDRLIDFDTTRGIWHWDVKRIQEKETTDNVVELMVGKLQKLPETTRNLLSLAACIGAQFELPTLATVNGKSWEETADELWESLQEGLVVPTNDAYKLVGTGKLEPTNGESVTPSEVPTYRFQHNRIQQVAYSFLSNDRQQYVHLTIGRLLLNRIDPEQSEEKIFDIVNQLNSGADLITDPEERDRLTRLNLTAGRRAKDSAAYEVSLNYLSTGLELLDGESWQKRYETALALHTEAAEAAYFCADFDRLDSLGKVVFSQARTLIDKIKIHELEILRRSADNRPLEAIEAGLLVLKEMGVYLPKAPNLLHIVWGLVRIKLALIGKPIDELNAMEDMTRPDILAALRILDHIGQASYFALPRLLPLIVMQYFRLSLKYGHSPATAFGFAGYGMMLSGVLERFEAGCRFGELALSVGERPSAR